MSALIENSILTNAPEDYDYDIVASNPVLGTEALRLVECKSDWKAETQQARYMSGLYFAKLNPSREDLDWAKQQQF